MSSIPSKPRCIDDRGLARPTIEELRDRRLNMTSADERVEFDEALAAARLALEPGEEIRDARKDASARHSDGSGARPRQ